MLWQLPTPLLVQLAVGTLGVVRSLAAVWDPSGARHSELRVSHSELPAAAEAAMGPLVVMPLVLPRAVKLHAHL